MSWFADLAGKAENLLNNLDEQTGAALRNHNTTKKPKEFYITDNTWNPKKRTTRNVKKGSVTETRSNISPNRTPSPQYPSRQVIREEVKASLKKNTSPTRKNAVYHLNNCPKTMVDDDIGDTELLYQYGLRQRRYSLPSELEEPNKDAWTLQIQNLETENSMLKNELTEVSKEMSELLGKLKKTEDGNDVVSKELNGTQQKLTSTQLENRKVNHDKEILISQMEKLKVKVEEISARDESQYQEIEQLNSEIMLLKHSNKDLTDRIEELQKKNIDAETIQQKLENDLRHAQTDIITLQNELTKSNAECQRLEKDWSTYKHRVKNMLNAKDNEIKCLQEGLNLTEDSKILVEQLESLKEERDELSEVVANVRNECETMKQCMSQLESKHAANERVIAALRDALKEERSSRTRAELQSAALAKELKTIQMETGQTIASLRTALRDKDNLINSYRETESSSVKTNDTSALNVADYDVTQDMENDRVKYLSDILVQRQGKIDKLLADNNMLRIQLDKLESKLKSGAHQPNGSPHSVVTFNTDCRQRRAVSDSALSTISQRMAAVVKRNPKFRTFIVVYMIVLHFWVLTVLLTSTPETYVPRQKRPA